jgi:hypothetical protein
MAASTSYTVNCDLYYQGNTAGSSGLQLQFTGPVMPANVVYGVYIYGNQTGANNYVATAYSTAESGLSIFAASPAGYFAHVSATVENGTTSGNLHLQFANLNGTSSITVLRGSWCQIF